MYTPFPRTHAHRDHEQRCRALIDVLSSLKQVRWWQLRKTRGESDPGYYQLLQREVLARPGRVQMEESPWGKGGGKWHSGNANLFIFRSQACRYWRTHLRSNGFVCWAWIIQKGYNIWQQHEQILKSLQVLAVDSCLFVVQAGSAVTKCWLQWNSAPPSLSGGWSGSEIILI